MKKTLLLVIGVITSFCLNAQNVPSFKISDNPTLGKIFLTDSTTNNKGTKIFSHYETLNNIQLKRLIKKKNELQNDNKNVLGKLSQNSEGNLALPESEISKLELAYKTSKESIEKLIPQIDSLSNEYVKEYLQYDLSTIFTFGSKRSRAFFDILYENNGRRFKILNNAGFNIGNKTGSIYSELISGNLLMCRVSLGAMISSSSIDSLTIAKEEEAYQKLVSKGGNTVLTFEYPLAYIHSRDNQFNLISRMIAKGTADFPEFGTTTEKWAGSASVGIDLYADAALSNNKLRFFGTLNLNRIWGTEDYKLNLGIDNSNFSFGQITLGLVFNQNIKLSFIVSTFSSEVQLRNKNVIAGGQVLN